MNAVKNAVKNWLGQERNRGYLYRVFTGAGVVAVAYGAVTSEEAVLLAGFVATLFGLPAANTSTKS